MAANTSGHSAVISTMVGGAGRVIWAWVPGGANTLLGAMDKLFETWKEKVETG